MKPEAVSVAQKPGQVPYYLRAPFKSGWMKESPDLFENVFDDEPVTWCSLVVVQPKPSYLDSPKENLKPHMIRASVDIRVPSKYME